MGGGDMLDGHGPQLPHSGIVGGGEGNGTVPVAGAVNAIALQAVAGDEGVRPQIKEGSAVRCMTGNGDHLQTACQHLAVLQSQNIRVGLRKLLAPGNDLCIRVQRSHPGKTAGVVTVIVGLVAPDAVALIGFLMFGNLIRECGVLNSLSETAQKVLANLITLFLGITIAARMKAEDFLTWETLLIIGLGLFAFVFDTFAGVMIAKFMNMFSKKKINPMIGAAGISAFPMSARVVHKMGLEEDNQNFLLMHSIGVNVSGQIASVIAGGLILALVR